MTRLFEEPFQEGVQPPGARAESGVGLQSSGLVPPQWRPERLAGQEAEEGLRLEGEEALEQLDGEELRALKVI